MMKTSAQKLFLTVIKMTFLASLLMVLLFPRVIWTVFSGRIGSMLGALMAVFWDPKTQWMIFLCLGVYFFVFVVLRSGIRRNFLRPSNSTMWLICALILNAITYIFRYPETQALFLISAAVLGQGMATCAKYVKFEVRNDFYVWTIYFMVILLCFASVLNRGLGSSFVNYGYARRSGLWNNPNMFGLLMGTGVVLALGSAVLSFESLVLIEPEATNWKSGVRVRKYAVAILYIFVTILIAHGLLHSYSRGAWLGTVCGLVYLFWLNFRVPKSKVQKYWNSWLKRNRFSFFVILITTLVLLLINFRQADWQPARRVLSVVNTVDFSWRNRIAAWEGALQITAEHPWLGWNQLEPLYEYYYLSPKLSESGAIEMNDYLILGATLGIPALFCFGMYFWLSLTQKLEARSRGLKSGLLPPTDLLSAICRAGAIVLLVGFWFDGGLFKLPTAATFWILLELGRQDLRTF